MATEPPKGSELCARSLLSAGRRHTIKNKQAINLFTVSSPLLRQVIIQSSLKCAASDELASRLATLCERLYLNRAIEPLAEAAELLASLPGDKAQAAGKYYMGLRFVREGRHAQAATLLEAVAEVEAAPRFRARALQSLGVIYRREGHKREAARLYQQSVSLAQNDPIAIIRAGQTLAEIHSSAGEHQRALEHLSAIRPLVEVVARIAPVYAALWSNDVAIDLTRLGRIEEARRFSQVALSSPVALAYPEWLETAQEIEQQAREKAARNRNLRPAVEQARSTSIKPKLRLVKKSRPVALPATTRRRTGPVTIIKPEPPRSRPILEQICLKIRIRAPSFQPSF